MPQSQAASARRTVKAKSARMLAVLLASAAALTSPLSAQEGADGPVPRVVFQDARPLYLEISPDGHILTGRGHVARHTFYAIDARAHKTLLMLNLPQQITDVAVAPQSDWFAVAGERTVFRVDLANGNYSVLLQNTTGQVALNAEGNRLAVLGVIDDEDVDQHWLWRSSVAELGIYDLQHKKWLARCKTPILIDSDVWFEKDVACAYGRGGRVFNRRASSFRCDVRLSPGGAEPQINRGREVFRSARDDDGYQPAVALAARTETHEAAKELLDGFRETLSPDRLRSEWVFLPLQRVGRERRPAEPGRRLYGGLLHVGADGAVSMLTLDPFNSRGVYRMGGRVVRIPYDNENPHTTSVEDLLTGEHLVTFPFQRRFSDVSHNNYWMLPLSHGFLVHQPETLTYYVPDKPEAAWQKPYERYARMPYPYGTSQDGKFLFLGAGEGPLAKILSARTGEVVMEVDREDRPTGYAASCNLNADGSRFACLSFDGRLQVREVPSGNKIYDEQLPPKTHYHYVTAAGDYWVLGSDSQGSRIIDTKTKTTVPFSLSRTHRASPLTALGRACLLVETREGRGGIVDVQTGRLHAQWYVGERQSSSGPPEGPPRAAALFDGKLLVRRTGHASDFELIDLATLDVVATIYPIHAGNTVGWITATPDGYWDATPGAEAYLEVFAAKRPLLGQQKATRRQPQLIRNRIAEIIAR